MSKRLISLAIAGLAIASLASAQATPQGSSAASGDKKELSVEESYLQESVETMVIREQTRSDSRDMKRLALDYIKESIDSGRAGEETQKALEYLALEGTMNQSREGGVGRVLNNFPDIRAKAASYLGDLGGESSKDTLLKIMMVDPEPMVLTEAVRSLGKIGLNENEETVATISWIVTRYDVLSPDNSLALAALDAFEKIAEHNGGIKDPSTVRTVLRIAEGNYIRPVQAKARDVLAKLRKYSSKDSSKEPAKK